MPKSEQKGIVYLYTERAQCGSCEYVQKQFEEMFLGVTVYVKSTYPW